MNDPIQALGPVSNPIEPAAVSSPSSEAVAAALDSILKSEVFAGAARQQRLLRHLVTKKLSGSAGELKEYTLGVEVFDRGDDFDPRLDPIVRVEASRLRSRLQKYYEAGGSADPIRITLPRGGYSPFFAAAPTELPPQTEQIPPPAIFPGAIPVAVPTEEHPALLPSGQSWWPKLALAAGFLALLVGGYFAFRKDADAATSASGPDFVRFRRVTSDEALCTSPTFSPDGKRIAYARRLNGDWDIYERDLDSLGFKNLTEGAHANNLQPAWSPDGKTLAFRSDRDGGGIFLLQIGSGAVSKLTGFGYLPSWSPDGSKIVFSTEMFVDPVESGAPQPSSLQIIDLKKKTPVTLGTPQTVYNALQPAWSPHGKRIAYWTTDRDGARDIWTVPADTERPTAVQAQRVTQDAWTDWSPAWSPDGAYLYFSSDRGGAMNLWRVRISEDSGKVLSKPEAVTTPSSYSGWTAFAPDGHQFAYVHRLVSSQLYRAPINPTRGIDLSQKLQLTAGERSLREPEMSPDGNWIVVRVQDPQEDLALVHPDGSAFHRLTDDPFNDRNPHWSPDGKYIAFTSNRGGRYEVWSVDADGSRPRQLTHDGALSYAWTPDGTMLGFPPDDKPIVLDPKGRALPNLNFPPVVRPISWSPAQSAIVARMRSNAFNRGALFVFFPQSQDYWQVSPNAPYSSTVWLHDGKSLMFSSAEGIFVADTQSRQVRAELRGFIPGMHSRFAVSHNDDQLFYVQSDDQEDVWIGAE